MGPEPIAISLRVCADLRRYLPDRAERLELKVAGGTTAGGALRLIGIPEPEVWLISVNGRQVSPGTPLNQGDQVMIVAPVAGG